MRITINAEDKETAIMSMLFAREFIKRKKDNDGTSDSWGFGFNEYGGAVTKKKNGNLSAKCKRYKDKAA